MGIMEKMMGMMMNRMDKNDKSEMMDRMMGKMMGNMDKTDRSEMMDKMMGNFFSSMSGDERLEIIGAMMPKMMEGLDMAQMMLQMMPEMMEKMMGGHNASGGGMMEEMMPVMMPQCLKIGLPRIGKEKRYAFAENLLTNLLEQGIEDMNETEKKEFFSHIRSVVERCCDAC